MQHSCAMNTQCMQDSFCNCMLCQRRSGTLAIITDVCADKGGDLAIFIYCWAGLRLLMYYRMGSIHSVKSEIIAAYFSTKFIQLLMVLCGGYVLTIYYYTYSLAHTGFSGLYYTQIRQH